jgi:dynein heavy chain
VLKSGSPQQVLDSLHTLLQSIMTLYKIARYYGTRQRITTLFSKITNQMIRLCKDSILAPGKLWDQDKTVLIANMQVRMRLAAINKSFDSYTQAWISLQWRNMMHHLTW